MSQIPSYSTQLAILTQARNNVVNLIALLTSQLKPDYAINGQSVQWGRYLEILNAQLPKLNEQIQIAGGPFELQTQAIPGAAGNFAGWWP